METLECIRTRRSCRSYKPDPIPEEILEKVLEAGTWAPTGRNLQSPIIVAITNPDERERLSQMRKKLMDETRDAFYGAPVVCIVLVDTNVATYMNDGELVIENMLLAAHDLGLAACYIWRAKQELQTEEGKQMLADWGLPGDVDFEGVGHVIVGYADMEAPNPMPRKENYVYYVK